jgi:hypothetical protein
MTPTIRVVAITAGTCLALFAGVGATITLGLDAIDSTGLLGTSMAAITALSAISWAFPRSRVACAEIIAASLVAYSWIVAYLLGVGNTLTIGGPLLSVASLGLAYVAGFRPAATVAQELKERHTLRWIIRGELHSSGDASPEAPPEEWPDTLPVIHPKLTQTSHELAGALRQMFQL